LNHQGHKAHEEIFEQSWSSASGLVRAVFWVFCVRLAFFVAGSSVFFVAFVAFVVQTLVVREIIAVVQKKSTVPVLSPNVSIGL
jgi:hypothetical protein